MVRTKKDWTKILKSRQTKHSDAKKYLKSSRSIRASEKTVKGKKAWGAQVRADKAEVERKRNSVLRAKKTLKKFK